MEEICAFGQIGHDAMVEGAAGLRGDGDRFSIHGRTCQRLSNEASRIGGGIGHVLTGSLRDVRLYNVALDAQAVQSLARV